MGHAHNHPAGWSCRCTPDPQACARACPVPPQTPCFGILWFFLHPPLSSGVPGMLGQGSPQ